MKIPSFKRIYNEDYNKFGKDLVNLVSQLAVSINNSFDIVYSALNKRISLRDNIACTVKDITVQVDSTGKPTSSTIIALDINTKVDALLVGKVDNLTNNGSYPTAGVLLGWEQNQTNVFINNITGLQANNNYQIRVIAFQQ